LIFTD
jgi:protein disulfide-isomerase A1